MAGRIIIAGILGGVLMYGFGAFWHMFEVPGDAGFKSYPGDAAVLRAEFGRVLTEPGIYFFPGMEEKPEMTPEEEQAAMEKWAEVWTAGPAGMIVYQPRGAQPMSGKQLGLQAASDIACGLVAAVLLAAAAAAGCGYLSRVLFTAALGLLASLTIDAPQWIWYAFPLRTMLASMAEQTLAFLIAGLAMAAVIRPQRAGAAAPQP